VAQFCFFKETTAVEYNDERCSHTSFFIIQLYKFGSDCLCAVVFKKRGLWTSCCEMFYCVINLVYFISTIMYSSKEFSRQLVAQTFALWISDAYLDRYSTTSISFHQFMSRTQTSFHTHSDISPTTNITVLQCCSQCGTAEFSELSVILSLVNCR
jgi:hypothetical protein